jgi:restriction endonuclease Mrr
MLTHSGRLLDIGPRRFEEVVGAAFSNQGFRTVLTPYSGDQGVDLRIVGNDGIGEVVTLVQLKRYDPKYPIDLSVVQALSGAVAAEKAHRGLVVTTSRYLPGVKRWIDEHRVPIELANSEHLATWFERAAQAMRAHLKARELETS